MSLKGLQITVTKAGAELHGSILKKLFECDTTVECLAFGKRIFDVHKFGTMHLDQADILALNADEDVVLSGDLYEKYYMVANISVLDIDVPEGFDNRTLPPDEEEYEEVRKVRDYVLGYTESTDGLTALIRCAHKVHIDAPSGASLNPNNFALWHSTAMGMSSHTAVQPNGLIESAQAVELMAGKYVVD